MYSLRVLFFVDTHAQLFLNLLNLVKLAPTLEPILAARVGRLNAPYVVHTRIHIYIYIYIILYQYIIGREHLEGTARCETTHC